MSIVNSETDPAVSAVQHLPPDMAIMKLENETIQSLAAARPRNHATIKAEIVEQLAAYPSFAKEAIYNKPVGRENDRCGSCGVELYRKNGRSQTQCFKCRSTDIVPGRMKYARNLSIRAAEAIAEAYGYCRIRTDVTPIDDLTVKVEATFTDYQKGRIWQDGGLLSKMFRRRDGKMERIPDDRFFNVVVKAELSRRVREVICRSVPPGLRSELFEMAEKQVNELLDDATIDKIVAQFATKAVTLDKLERRLGRTRDAGWTKGDRLDLLGLWNAIRDGETTVAEAFADLANNDGNDDKTPQKPAAAGGGATVDDLLSPQATPTPAATDDHSGAEATDVDADQDLLVSEYRDLIGGADAIARVNELQKHAAENPELTPETRAIIAELLDKQREVIRSTRGERSTAN